MTDTFSKEETVTSSISNDNGVSKGSERILFVDDEEMLAQMGKVVLERCGYRVTTKPQSLEALELFQNQSDEFDLVITDQTMPGITGLDLAQKMKHIRPDIPIILCTGFSAMVNEEVTKAQGISGYIEKPYENSVLISIVRKVLDNNEFV